MRPRSHGYNRLKLDEHSRRNDICTSNNSLTILLKIYYIKSKVYQDKRQKQLKYMEDIRRVHDELDRDMCDHVIMMNCMDLVIACRGRGSCVRYRFTRLNLNISRRKWCVCVCVFIF